MYNGNSMLNCEKDISNRSRDFGLADHSDPVILYGKVIAQQIKGTLGITGLYLLRVHIDRDVWHLDVGLTYPGEVGFAKGLAVRRLKCYMNWV